MSVYYQDDSVTLYHGDCLAVMAELDEASVDTVLTDPPYPILVWDKAKLGMGAIFRNQHEFIVHMSAGNPTPPQRRDMPNVLRYPSVRDGDHPTEKPTALLQDLLSVVAAPGSVVLDPFAGSGSTLTAAQATGRKAIGIEADERYCEIAARRLAQDVLDFGEGA